MNSKNLSLSELVPHWRTQVAKGAPIAVATCAMQLEAALAQQAQEVCMCVDGAICGWCKKPFRIAQQAQPEIIPQNWTPGGKTEEDRVIERIAALHQPITHIINGDFDLPIMKCDGCGKISPCPTMRAITNSP